MSYASPSAVADDISRSTSFEQRHVQAQFRVRHVLAYDYDKLL